MAAAKGILKFFLELRGMFKNSSNDNSTKCEPLLSVSQVYLWSLIPAIVLTIAMTLILPRRNTRYFQFPVSMNILEKHSHHVSYSLALACTASIIYRIFSNDENILIVSADILPSWANIPLKVFACIVYGLTYYPMFVCISNQELFNFVLGSIYLVGLILSEIYITLQCMKEVLTSKEIAITIFGALPTTGCQVILLLIFLNNIFWLAKSRKRWHQEAIEDPYDVYCSQYVSNIFRAKIEYDKELTLDLTSILKDNSFELAKQNMANKISAIKKEIWQKRKEAFIFPPRLIITLVVSFVLVYLLFFVAMVQVVVFFNNVQDFLWSLFPQIYKNNSRTAFDVAKTLLGEKSGENDSKNFEFDLLYSIFVALNAAKFVIITSLTLSFLVAVLHLVLIGFNFRTNLLALYSGDFTWIRPIRHCGSSTSLLLGCSKYCGFQIGYLAWGFVLLSLILVIAFSILTFGFIIPIIYGFGGFLWPLIRTFLPTFVFLIIITIGQTLLAKFVFLASPERNLYIKNRNFFFTYTYLIFFYNIFLGLLSCLLRIVRSVIYGTLFMGRLDWSILPRFFENSDAGYTSYLGFIHVENCHNNPILRCFLSNLKKRNLSINLKTVSINENSLDENETTNKDCRSSKAARNKWHIFYTLVKNPILKKYRKSNSPTECSNKAFRSDTNL